MKTTQSTYYKLEVGVHALLTYQAHPVGYGVRPSIGQRQMRVWLQVPVYAKAESLPEAQFKIPEVLEGSSPEQLKAYSQIFSLTRVPPPEGRSIAGLEILDPDSFSLISSEEIQLEES